MILVGISFIGVVSAATTSGYSDLSLTPQIVSGDTTTPIGGDKGEIVIKSDVEGAKVELYDINNGLAYSGKIVNGTAVIYVYSTGTPLKKAVVSSAGYETASVGINGNPASGKVSTYTVNLKPSQSSITIPEPTTQSTTTTLNLRAGWNFISVPKYLDSSCDTVDELLAGLKTSKSPIGYDSTRENGWYTLIKGMKIEPLNGYWIYADAPMTINLKYSNDATQTPPVKTVYKGWNAVGICADKAMTAKSAFANLNWASYLPWDVSSGHFGTPIVNGGSVENSEDKYITLESGGWLYVDAGGTLLGSTA